MPQGSLNPAQNFDHLLDPVSGYDGMHDLQYKAGVVEGEAWFRGAVTSLNQDGDLKASCGDAEMPLFAINATDDFDVASETFSCSISESAGKGEAPPGEIVAEKDTPPPPPKPKYR